MKKLTIMLIVVLSSCYFMQAQQVNQLNNFMYNQLYFNPASAGMHETQVNVAVIGRIQWASIEGAPKLAHVWADYRFPSKRMALGLNIGSYTYSKYSFTDANANYAYSIQLTKKTKLAMGLRAGITSVSASTNESKIWSASDPLIASNNYSGVLPKIGVGFQLNAPNYYVGISAPDLYVSDKKKVLSDSSSFLNQQRNFILMSGAKLRLNDSYNLRPSLAVFYHPLSGAFLTVNSTFEVRDYFWIGVSYATYKAVAFNTGVHLSNRIRFAYSYELLSGVSKAASIGSHEICLMIKLDNIAHKRVRQ